MQAKDIMIREVVKVRPETPVKEVISTMIKTGASGVPVVNEEGKLVGLITSRDLVARGKSLWATFFKGHEVHLNHGSFLKGQRLMYGATAADVMLKGNEIISVDEKAELTDIAAIFLERNIGRLPVVRRGKVVGMITRRGLLKAILELEMDWEEKQKKLSDDEIRIMVMDALRRNMGLSLLSMRVRVKKGVVHLQGAVASREDIAAAEEIAASVPGVCSVDNALLVEGMLA